MPVFFLAKEHVHLFGFAEEPAIRAINHKSDLELAQRLSSRQSKFSQSRETSRPYHARTNQHSEFKIYI